MKDCSEVQFISCRCVVVVDGDDAGVVVSGTLHDLTAASSVATNRVCLASLLAQGTPVAPKVHAQVAEPTTGDVLRLSDVAADATHKEPAADAWTEAVE